MTERSLQASSKGIQAAKVALIEKFSTQQRLANALEVSRQPVSKFFNGKPVDSGLFVQICERLGLDWKMIAINLESDVKLNPQQEVDIDTLLVEVRKKIKPKIQEQCGLMRVLDMTHPIGLCDIYTDVNILETVTGRRWVEIDELLKSFDPDSDSFDRRGLGKVTEKRVPGLNVVGRYPKLMVLGKPGAGKTTFLKYLAIQCIWENFQAKRIPIFITLKDFAEAKNQPDFLCFISEIFSAYDVDHAQVSTLLEHGRILILLDGLDEVREEDSDHVIKQINLFSEQYFFSKDFKIEQSSLLNKRARKLEEITTNKDRKIEEAKELRNKNNIKLEKYQEIYDEATKEFEDREKELSRQYPELLKNLDQGLTFLSNKFPQKVYIIIL